MKHWTLTDYAIVSSVILFAIVAGGLILWACVSCSWPPFAATQTPAALAAVECTPDATQAARLSAVETRAAILDDVLVEVAAVLAAVPDNATPTATPRPSETPRPTPTREFLPTATPTATPVALCRACGDSTQNPRVNCPIGYWCRLCAAGRWMCVRNESPSADCQLCAAASMPVESPEWSMPEWSEVGYMTYYTDTVTASGEPFLPDGATCSVDCDVYGMLEGLTLRITNVVDGRFALVYANDCGHLYQKFIKSQRVVVDVPYLIALKVGDGNTTLVSVTVEREEPAAAAPAMGEKREKPEAQK